MKAITKLIFSAAILVTAHYATAAAAAPATKATSIDEAKHVGRLYVSAEPSEQALAKFKKEKGAVVLDLRQFDELGDCGQPVAASKLGLQYNRVVFEKGKGISRETVEGIDKVVKDAGDKPVLLFCKTGNRAASYLAISLVRDQKMPVEDAIKTAKNMGLKDELAQAVREYLKANPN